MVFKIGDKVRLKEDYFLWKKGATGIITWSDHALAIPPEGSYFVGIEGEGRVTTLLAIRLELVPEEKTEQELVDEYMAAMVIARSIRDDLLSLGYELHIRNRAASTVPLTEYYFYKEVRSVIELKASGEEK